MAKLQPKIGHRLRRLKRRGTKDTKRKKLGGWADERLRRWEVGEIATSHLPIFSTAVFCIFAVIIRMRGKQVSVNDQLEEMPMREVTYSYYGLWIGVTFLHRLCL